MKRILLPLFMLLLPLLASAYDVQIDGIYYNLDKNAKTAEVTFRSNTYRSYSGDVTIPPSITHSNVTYSVTSIGGNAFADSKDLTSVYIPNSVTSIGGSAFGGCSNLALIDIPNSIKSIGGYAFHDTPWYDNQPDGLIYIGSVAYKYKGTMPENTSVVIKEGTTCISGGAFQDNCMGLISIEIPNSVTSIGNRAFYNCMNLTSIEIPNSVTSIGEDAFWCCAYHLTSIKVAEGNPIYDSRGNCNALIETASNTLLYGCQNTIIPNSVTSIGDEAFTACLNLTSISIPNSVTSIGDNAFVYCINLTSISIPNSVTSIGNNAFYYCSNLTSIEIPSSVTYVGHDVFEETPWYKNQPDGLLYVGRVAYRYKGTMPENTNVVLKENTTCIGYYAFSGCTGMTSIMIPKSVASIGSQAFWYCSGLTSIKVAEDNIVYDSRNNCNAIIETASNTLIVGCRNTVIPNSVTTVGNDSFYGCTGLVSIDIPEGVTSIGYSVFENCTGLTTVYLPHSLKRIYNYIFKGCNNIKDVYCLAENIPSDKDLPFSGVDLRSATLHVLESCINMYQRSRWSAFGNIVAIDITEIQNVNAAKEGQGTEQIFSLDGKPQNELQKGINIVRYSDGTTKKVWMR